MSSSNAWRISAVTRFRAEPLILSPTPGSFASRVGNVYVLTSLIPTVVRVTADMTRSAVFGLVEKDYDLESD